MTKNNLLTPVMEMVKFGGDCQEAQKLFNKFFDSNICIPKGENRHPCADVWHEWVEDTSKVMQYYGNNQWWKSLVNNVNEAPIIRIKPSDPIYEWQYVLLDRSHKEIARTCFMTEDEYEASEYFSAQWDCDFEMKRERK